MLTNINGNRSRVLLQNVLYISSYLTDSNADHGATLTFNEDHPTIKTSGGIVLPIHLNKWLYYLSYDVSFLR